MTTTVHTCSQQAEEFSSFSYEAERTFRVNPVTAGELTAKRREQLPYAMRTPEIGDILHSQSGTLRLVTKVDVANNLHSIRIATDTVGEDIVPWNDSNCSMLTAVVSYDNSLSMQNVDRVLLHSLTTLLLSPEFNRELGDALVRTTMGKDTKVNIDVTGSSAFMPTADSNAANGICVHIKRDALSGMCSISDIEVSGATHEQLLATLEAATVAFNTIQLEKSM